MAVRCVASFVLAVFWTIDYFFLQKRPRASAVALDEGSARVWDAANAVQLGGMAIGFTSAGRIPGVVVHVQWTGLVLMGTGILLRWMAMRTLGDLFTGKVVIQEDHRLVRSGLYRCIRHPAYTGSLIAHLGLGLAFANWWTLAASTLPYSVAVLYRLRIEERALADAFGDEYVEHARTTARLVPWVY